MRNTAPAYSADEAPHRRAVPRSLALRTAGGSVAQSFGTIQLPLGDATALMCDNDATPGQHRSVSNTTAYVNAAKTDSLVYATPSEQNIADILTQHLPKP